MTERILRTTFCDHPECTRTKGPRATGWTRKQIWTVGSWSGEEYQSDADLCPAHRGYKGQRLPAVVPVVAAPRKRRKSRRTVCPDSCVCVCHAMGGGSVHVGSPCPGKVDAGSDVR